MQLSSYITTIIPPPQRFEHIHEREPTPFKQLILAVFWFFSNKKTPLPIDKRGEDESESVLHEMPPIGGMKFFGPFVGMAHEFQGARLDFAP